jgi:SAM-dependent methyltransferase
LRTAADFDEWYVRSGGDPWRLTGNPINLRRLELSLAFIKKHVGGCPAAIVELGCFHGEFTAMLAREFADASIIANDFSSVALAEARHQLQAFLNVKLVNCDMAEFEPPACDALLLLECLYYLGAESEMVAALIRLTSASHPRFVFVSGPITGPPYFTWSGVRRIAKAAGLKAIDARPVSWTKWPTPRYARVPVLRWRRANQVIVCLTAR